MLGRRELQVLAAGVLGAMREGVMIGVCNDRARSMTGGFIGVGVLSCEDDVRLHGERVI